MTRCHQSLHALILGAPPRVKLIPSSRRDSAACPSQPFHPTLGRMGKGSPSGCSLGPLPGAGRKDPTGAPTSSASPTTRETPAPAKREGSWVEAGRTQVRPAVGFPSGSEPPPCGFVVLHHMPLATSRHKPALLSHPRPRLLVMCVLYRRRHCRNLSSQSAPRRQ